MSRSYDDNDSRRHDHHHGLIGSILDFVEDEDAMKMSRQNQPQAALQQDTMVCSHCKTVIPAHSKFCPECGVKQTDALHCTNCGSTLAADSKFCLNCGQKVS